MEAVYTLLGFIGVLVLPALLVVGLARPQKFNILLKGHANRGKIVGIIVLSFVILTSIAGAIEPESVKLARQQKEQQTQQQLESQKTEEFEQQQEAPATNTQQDEASKNQAKEDEARQAAEDQKRQERSYWHKVVRVVDGDTIRVLVDGKEESIRVIGLNAPESTTKNECFGKNASSKARDIVKDGWVQLEKDDSQGNRDKYNRLLRFVWAGDGSTDFGLVMISEGYAHEYTYRIPYAKQQSYKGAQKNAENSRKGLWAPGTCDSKKEKPQTVAPKTPSQSQTTPAPAPSSSGAVKKSSTNICHAPGTTYYNRTKNYTPYHSLQACLDSGGRLPKR